MAKTDENDPGPSSAGWTMRGMLNAITGWFQGGARQPLVVSTDFKTGQGVVPVEVELARKRVSDPPSYGGGLSRMEEAKQRNAVWENDIEKLLLLKLKTAFHADNFKRMRLTLSKTSNPMRRIVEELSILYQTPAKRYIKEDVETISPDATNKAEPPPNEYPTQQKALPADIQEPPKLDTGDSNIDALSEVMPPEDMATPGKKTPLECVMALCDLDTVLDLVEKKCRIHEAVWVRPYVSYEGTIEVLLENGQKVQQGDPATAKLTYIVYDPSCADVVPNPANPTEAVAWYYFGEEYNTRGEQQRVIHFYTEDTYCKLTADWKMIGSGSNPIGRLPVTVFRKELPSIGSYYCRGVGRDLFEATLEDNFLRTIQNSRFKDGAFKQLVLTNADSDAVPADQIMGGPTPIYVPEGGTATVLDMQPMLDQMTEMADHREHSQAARYGISQATYKQEGTPVSGFAKKLDMARVLKENLRIRKFFQEGEKDLYNLLAMTLDACPIEGVEDLDTEAEFCVDFAEPTFDEDPKDQAAVDAQQIKLNLISILDVLRRENPDLNDTELIMMAYRNKRINEAFIPSSAMTLLDTLALGGGAPSRFGGGGGFNKGAPSNQNLPPGKKEEP